MFQQSKLNNVFVTDDIMCDVQWDIAMQISQNVLIPLIISVLFDIVIGLYRDVMCQQKDVTTSHERC